MTKMLSTSADEWSIADLMLAEHLHSLIVAKTKNREIASIRLDEYRVMTVVTMRKRARRLSSAPIADVRIDVSRFVLS